MSFLIPCVNAYDLDPNLLNKMFPLTFSSNEVDVVRTCCSKFNSGFCNLKNVEFDRKQICTLDGWLVEMFECVVLKEKGRIFPTCYFENQRLTDVMCTLLYLTDLYLDGRCVNLVFKEKLFLKYKELFTDDQQSLLLEILLEFNKNESDKLIGMLKRRFSLASIRSLIGSCKSKVDNDNLFIPIQNVSLDWMLGAGISKYSTKIFVDSTRQYLSCNTKNSNAQMVIFGFTDSLDCQIKYCIYNIFRVIDDFDEW